MLLIAILASRASAAPAGCGIVTAADVAADLDGVDQRLEAQQFDDARGLLVQTRDAMACVEQIVLPSDFARMAHQQALVAFLGQNEEEAVHWGLAANYAVPDAPWPAWADIPSRPLRDDLARAAEPAIAGPSDKALLVPKGGGAFLNGAPLPRPVARSELPALVQIADRSGVVIAAWWQEGPTFPATALGPAGAVQPTPSWFDPEDPLAALAVLRERYGGGEVAATVACTPMTADRFVELVGQASAALDGGDTDGFGAANRQITQDLPCLGEQLPQAEWAQFLVDLAIVEHAVGGDWQEPLRTALIAMPSVDRSAAPDAIRSWAPPTTVARASAPLPDDATYYLDGRQIATVPDTAGGLHVLQRYAHGTWETRLVRSTPFPADWAPAAAIAPPTKAPTDPGLHGHVALAGGFGNEAQALDSPGSYLDAGHDPGGTVGIASAGTVVPGAVGGFWDVAVPLELGVGLHADAYAGAAFALGPLAIVAGGGVSTVGLTAGDRRELEVVGQPHVGVDVGVPLGGVALALGAGGGAIPGAAHALAHVGIEDAGDASVGWFGGVDLAWAHATFAQQSTVPRDVGLTRLTVGVRAGIRFGGLRTGS
jgi:hypothetical protein